MIPDDPLLEYGTIPLPWKESSEPQNGNSDKNVYPSSSRMQENINSEPIENQSTLRSSTISQKSDENRQERSVKKRSLNFEDAGDMKRWVA